MASSAPGLITPASILLPGNPHTNELMGISVKSRSRNVGAEGEHVRISNDDLDKAAEACHTFECVPYFAIVVDEACKIYSFIIPMTELLELFPKRVTSSSWKMTPKHIEEYRNNPKIMMFEFTHSIHRWWT